MNNFDNENHHKNILEEREANMTAHTPGPWNLQIVPWGEDFDLKIVSKGVVLATMNKTALENNADANARLIAAAPELLAACIEALDWTLCTEVREQLTAAIAKARAE